MTESQTHIVQVWFVPALPPGEPLQLANGVRVRTVALPTPFHSITHTSLAELATSVTDAGLDLESEFRKIGEVLIRLSFARLIPNAVLSARLVRVGLQEGDASSEIVFPGAPPGISVFESRLGFRRTPGIEPTRLIGEFPPEVDIAITWFMWGNGAPNLAHQALCHWIGLEALAPPLAGPWYCNACEMNVEECPHCGSATEGPKTVQTVRRYLTEQLAVSKKEYRTLYDLRCRLAHGALGAGPDAIQAAANHAVRIQQLLLTGIKERLGWPSNVPPFISPEGMTIVGTPGLTITGVVSGVAYYDSPPILPA